MIDRKDPNETRYLAIAKAWGKLCPSYDLRVNRDNHGRIDHDLGYTLWRRFDREPWQRFPSLVAADITRAELENGGPRSRKEIAHLSADMGTSLREFEDYLGSASAKPDAQSLDEMGYRLDVISDRLVCLRKLLDKVAQAEVG